LKAHNNEYRSKRGLPPLKWNAQLAADAQKCGNHFTTISEECFLILLSYLQSQTKVAETLQVDHVYYITPYLSMLENVAILQLKGGK